MIIRCPSGTRPLRTCLRSRVSWSWGPVIYGWARAAARVRSHLNLTAADVQMQRCILSVTAQSYPNGERIIVSDGPDDELLGKPRSFLPNAARPSGLGLSLSLHPTDRNEDHGDQKLLRIPPRAFSGHQ
jgi:hypothetical protein